MRRRFELAPGRQARRTLRLGSRARTALAASRGRVRVLAGAGAATTLRVR